MSIENKKVKSFLEDKNKIAFTGSIAVLLIAAIIGITSFYLGKNQGEKSQSPIPVIDLSADSQRVLGAQTYNWNGRITGVKNSELTMLAAVTDENNSQSEKEITVLFNEATEIIKWDLTKPSADGSSGNKETVSPDQLAAGQRIIVKSLNDLNGDNEVNASGISLLITPTN